MPESLYLVKEVFILDFKYVQGAIDFSQVVMVKLHSFLIELLLQALKVVLELALDEHFSVGVDLKALLREGRVDFLP